MGQTSTMSTTDERAAIVDVPVVPRRPFDWRRWVPLLVVGAIVAFDLAMLRPRTPTQRWKRYEKPLPGHRVQVDVKFLGPIGAKRKKHYQFTAIDDCTRIRVLRIYDRNNQKTAIQFIDYVLEKLPFRVECIQTDNGAEFQGAFHWHVLDRGIGDVFIKPATPRLNGKVERSHRIDAEEFYRMLDGAVIDDAGVFNDKLKQWEDYYNFERPHGGLNGATPYERLRQKTQAQPVTGLSQQHT